VGGVILLISVSRVEAESGVMMFVVIPGRNGGIINDLVNFFFSSSFAALFTALEDVFVKGKVEIIFIGKFVRFSVESTGLLLFC
jgi:hypothetical protein